MLDLFRRSWVIIALAMVLTLLVMMPSLNAPFFFDDNPNIVDNTAIQIKAFNIHELAASLSGPRSGLFGRPISVLSFATTYYFFGLDPFAFKLINLCIHLINGALLFWLLTLLFNKTLKTSYVWLPIWITTIWLIHPINFLPIMLSVQRMTLLSALFMLLALISHLKFTTIFSARRIIWGCAGWLVFFPLSVLSKETGLLFPLYVTIITLLPTVDSEKYQHKSNHALNKYILFLSVLLLLSIAVWMMFIFGNNWLDTAYATRAFSLEQRLMTEARALWFYVGQIVLPTYKMFAIYHDDFLLSSDLFNPVTTIVSILAWMLVVGLILLKWYRYPILCFAVAWFLVGHLLESTFIPLEIMHEHRNYFPSIGLIIFASYLALIFINKLKLTNQTRLIMMGALMPVVLLSFFTWMRANQLGNPLVGAQMEAAQHPQSARANYSAAEALIKAGYGDSTDKVVGEKIKLLLERSNKADPSFKLSYMGLIIWACASGRDVERSWIQEFSQRLEFAPFGPGEIGLAKNLFDALSSMPKCLSRTDADQLFMAGANNQKIAVRQRVSFFEYAADYALIVQNDVKSAKIYLARAATFAPHDPKIKEKLKIADKAMSGKDIKIHINEQRK